jgi:hypothetical protein
MLSDTKIRVAALGNPNPAQVLARKLASAIDEYRLYKAEPCQRKLRKEIAGIVSEWAHIGDFDAQQKLVTQALR